MHHTPHLLPAFLGVESSAWPSLLIVLFRQNLKVGSRPFTGLIVKGGIATTPPPTPSTPTEHVCIYIEAELELQNIKEHLCFIFTSRPLQLTA
jgi:hypothetical protein